MAAPRSLLVALAAALVCAAGLLATRSLASYSSGGSRCAHRADYRQGGGPPAPVPCRHGRPVRGHGACRGALLHPTAANIQAVRSAVFCLVNRERTRRGEAPLRPNLRLRRAAQLHSQSMTAGGYFDHVEPGGATPLVRMRRVGYISKRARGFAVGENIAWGTGSLSTPRAIVAAWMASAGHRANILDPRYRDTAIGVSPRLPASLAHGRAGALYTQDFGVVLG